jgi:diguanylate cyclase (GGDEF)-like protein
MLGSSWSHYLNPKLQSTQNLNAQESRLAVIKRRAYLVACVVAIPGIITGALASPGFWLNALYVGLLSCTLIILAMLVNKKFTIGRIEHFGFSYSTAFIVLRGVYVLLNAQNATTLGAAMTETYQAMAFVALLGYILLDTRRALRISVAVVGCITLLSTIRILGMMGSPDYANLIVVAVRAFANAVAFVAFSYVLSLTKDLLAVEQIRSSTDSLTGASNRWQMYNALEAEFVACQTQKRIFSVILLDIDNFKRINDTHGHDAGDSVLQEVARVLKKYTANLGSVARWGGEEFLILMPHASLEQARVHAENLRVTLAKRNFKVGQVTGSFGVASLLPPESTTDLMRRADEALYNAKRSGRNRVEMKARASQALESLDLELQDPRNPSLS